MLSSQMGLRFLSLLHALPSSYSRSGSSGRDDTWVDWVSPVIIYSDYMLLQDYPEIEAINTTNQRSVFEDPAFRSFKGQCPSVDYRTIGENESAYPAN